MNKTKFAIGCLVQWYECDIIEEYIDSLKDAIDAYSGEVLVDFIICLNQDLEQCVSNEQLEKCRLKILNKVTTGLNSKANVINNLYTIADYRREFNDNYCNKCDVLMWGESDSLLPKQTFNILDNLHQNTQTPKYLAFFGTCKMWDESWKPIEHNDFTDKPFIENDVKNWWSLRYDMTKQEMNEINKNVEELDVQIVSPHKFNGCGLVISSEVVKAGVNIPKSVFFVHEDSAFMMMTNKVLGDIPQYIIKNILLVHNRKHKNKRNYIKNESQFDSKDPGIKRRSHKWYTLANKMCEQNYHNLFNTNWKSYTWDDVFKKTKNESR